MILSKFIMMWCLIACFLQTPTYAQPVEHLPKAPDIVRMESGDAVERGLVPLGGEAKRVLTVRNDSSEKVSLRLVQTTCQCVSAVLEKDLLDPGEVAIFTISVVVSGGVGEQRHAATLEAATVPREGSREPRRKQSVVVGISYIPNREYEIVPRVISTTGIVGVERRFNISVIRMTAGDLLIEDPVCTLDGFRVETVKLSKANKAVQIIEVVGSPVQEGIVSGFVRFGANSEKLPVGQVEISVRGLTPWRVEPAGAVFVHNGEDKPMERRLRLVRRMKSAPELAAAASKIVAPGVEFAFQPGEDAVVRVDPAKLADPTGSVTVKLVDASGNPGATVPIVWYKRAAAGRPAAP